MKKRMLQTLNAAYGREAAAQITPISFALPEELPQWKAYIAYAARMQASKQSVQSKSGKEQSEKSGTVAEVDGSRQDPSRNTQSDQLWILKTGQDAGRMNSRATTCRGLCFHA